MAKIVVVGSVAIDFTVQTEKRPNPGETIVGQQLLVSFGGKGANQAVAASRLGVEVMMVGCVGADVYGVQIIDNLKENKVDTRHIYIKENQTTGSAHITLCEGENSILVVKGANDSLDIETIDKAKSDIRNADIVMVQQETPITTIAYLVEMCYQLGVPVLLNPAPIQAIAAETIEKATYITPNEHEAQALFPDKKLEEIFGTYPNKLIMTQGANGAAYHNGQNLQLIPAFKVKAIDTTGAGDTFNAAFAVAIAEKMPMDKSLRFANAAAALSVQALGAQNGMPERNKVMELLNDE